MVYTEDNDSKRSTPMKLVSWNVNGLRACMKKGFSEAFEALDADIFALQETKMTPDQADFPLPDRHIFWNSAEKKGYSGTAVLTKEEPEDVAYGIDLPEHDREGRVITLRYSRFYFVNVYTPNAQDGLKRLDYRMDWEDAFRDYLLSLDRDRPVVLCGDLNVAHREIDLKNPKTNVNNAGFTPQEREKMTRLLESGFTDTFRLLYPDREGAYSWWSYRFNARQNNAGWRIDYFLVSDRLSPAVEDSLIHSDIFGSDHCPVELRLKEELL